MDGDKGMDVDLGEESKQFSSRHDCQMKPQLACAMKPQMNVNRCVAVESAHDADDDEHRKTVQSGNALSVPALDDGGSG
jgi:hypothetical protein